MKVKFWGVRGSIASPGQLQNLLDAFGERRHAVNRSSQFLREFRAHGVIYQSAAHCVTVSLPLDTDRVPLQ